ncbi:Helicase [Plasmodium coatneyi]|uniref:Helicase n=1 Tax=Plasmodium coatneyi TaxID=208452 RepID=A0A1B1E3S3_9APIC|nr:Helicase [Plasmodium coatneyi]ANQ09580.1 Helicase [Plasmodium coatneyi]
METQFDEEIKQFFPFPPYKIQLDFMKTLYNVLKKSNLTFGEEVRPVYDIIQKNQNLQKMVVEEVEGGVEIFNGQVCAGNSQVGKEDGDPHEDHIISEMKTGSGKSLSLLTPLVYWLLKHKFDFFLLREDTHLRKEEPEWVKESVTENLLRKFSRSQKVQKKRKEEDLTILNRYFYISDDKITLKGNLRVEKKQVQVVMHKPGEDRFDTQGEVDNLSDCSVEGPSKKQIFICSRTQSQLNQYFSELKKIEERVGRDLPINMVILGSRKHLCVNEPFLKKCRSVNELNDCCRNSDCRYKKIFKENMLQRRQKREKKKNKIFYDSSSSSGSTSDRSDDSSSNGRLASVKPPNSNLDNYSLVSKLINCKNLKINQVKNICMSDQIEVCPYYLSRENVKNADIVLLPYVCILNEHVRRGLKISIKNNIVIFDEAQNIIDSINDSNSAAITYGDILFCKYILEEYAKKYQQVLNNSNVVSIKQVVIYCDMLLSSFKGVKESLVKVTNYILTSQLDALNLNHISNLLSNSTFCRRIKIFAETYLRKNFPQQVKNLSTSVNTSAIYLLSDYTNKMIRSNRYDYVFLHRGGGRTEKEEPPTRLSANGGPNKRSCFPTEGETHMERIKRFKQGDSANVQQKTTDDTATCIHSNADDTISAFVEDLITRKNPQMFHRIEIVSVSSCSNFEKITNDCSNVILIGGTLQPIEEFLLLFMNQKEKKKSVKLFLSDYIFKESNVFCRIISTNLVTYEPIDNTFKSRNKKTHLLNLAIQIHLLTLHVRFGNIVFFSSYKFLREFFTFLQNEGQYVLTEMKRKKNIFFEEKNGDNDVLKDYMQSVQQIRDQQESACLKNGCILFCVMNAKLSEGINFYDDFCRNVLLVGIPFFKHEKGGSSSTSTGDLPLDRNSLRLDYYRAFSADVAREADGAAPPSTQLEHLISDMCRTYELKSAMKIVNQCIGRSLRHVDDYSSFFFLDYRFANKEFSDLFPSFIRANLAATKGDSSLQDQQGGNFLEEKKKMKEVFENFRHHYCRAFPDIPFAEHNESHWKSFTRDVFLLREFHAGR